MRIKKGDDLVMIIKGRKILLEKSEDLGLLLDSEFKDVKTVTEQGLKKVWLNRKDNVWDTYGKQK